jgi:hypothetical protein
MPEKNPRLSPLESRKRLLIAESELNRAQMVADLGALKSDLDALKSDVNTLLDRVKSLGSIASTAAVLVSGLTAFRGGKAENGDGKSHWLRKVIRGAGLVSTIWRVFRPKRGVSTPAIKPAPDVEEEEGN